MDLRVERKAFYCELNSSLGYQKQQQKQQDEDMIYGQDNDCTLDYPWTLIIEDYYFAIKTQTIV